MKLLKDGTAELTVGEHHIHLPVVTWGKLKDLKKRSMELGEALEAIMDGISASLTEDQRQIYSDSVTLIRTGDADAADASIRNLPEEDQEAIGAALEQLGKIRETSTELTVAWWAKTIEELTGSAVDPDDLPAQLSMESSITRYLAHVQSVPFDFSQ